jgi:hypothetical protein
VFTYKAGLLSAVAHDLKIRVTKFMIDVDEHTRAIEARFDAASLRVVCAMEDGKEARGSLSAADRREIGGRIVRDVLHASEYPEIRFTSTAVQERGDGYVVKGKLALHGKERVVSVRVQQEGPRYIAEARLHQPDFGIRPYAALFGTLKVQADVTVRVCVPTAARLAEAVSERTD